MTDRYANDRTQPVPQKLLDQIAAEIRRELDRLDWPVERLARKAGVSLRTAYRAQAASTIPSYGTLHALAQAMGCEVQITIRRPWRRRMPRAEHTRAAWTTEDEAELVRRWQENETTREIAAAMGRTGLSITAHVCLHRERLGLARRRPGRRKPHHAPTGTPEQR